EMQPKVETTHPLRTPELLGVIFENLPSSDNAVNAQVCKAWYNNVLQILWREVDSTGQLMALLALLGPWTFSDPEDKKVVFPEEPDWERFLYRATFVKSLSYAADAESLAVLQFLSHSLPVLTLFPNLSALTCESFSSNTLSFPLCSMFAHSGLKYLNLKFSQESSAKIIPVTLPVIHLQGLRCFVITAHEVSDLVATIEVLCGIPNLETLVIPRYSGSVDVLEAASKLPAMKQLLSTHGRYQDCSHPDEAIHPKFSDGCFPAAKTLTISGCELHLSTIIHQSRFPIGIDSLHVDYKLRSPFDDVTNFHKSVAEFCANVTSYSFRCDWGKLSISFGQLQPLLSLKLSHLVIASYYPLTLTENELTELVTSLPSLTLLHLNQSPRDIYNEFQTGIAIELLPIIATSCRNLQELGIFLDVRRLSRGFTFDDTPFNDNL
ncbi:hypothetical protein H0H93_010911, partial [Arthromyces matolae]